MIRPKLLEFLKCADCMAPLTVDADPEGLVCLNPACRRRYGVLEGYIPNMLVEESTVMEEAAWTATLARLGAKPAAAGAAPRRPRPKPAPRPVQG